MKLIGKVILVTAAIFLLLQLFHPSIPAKPTTTATPKLAAPPQVAAVLRKDCYACHSDERRLAWFDQIEPAYFSFAKTCSPRVNI
jgi:hypothetical protein